MRIAVCVAAVPNPDKVKWDRFRQLLDVQDAEPILNPADRGALELAAQIAKAKGATFDAYSAGVGASAALREAAVFGAGRLYAITDRELQSADEAGVAAALACAIAKDGPVDLVLCGAATSSFGSGAVPGYLSALLDAQLRADVVAVVLHGGALKATLISGGFLILADVKTPAVLAAAAYGIAVRAISPILLVRASKKPIEEVSTADVASGRMDSAATSGVTDGPLESNRKKRANEFVEGLDAAARAITLVAALRDRELV